jgi:hypothetical protein
VREIIYRRVKSGYGVDSDSETATTVNRNKLKQLSPSYIDYRKGVAIFFTGKNGNIIRLGAYDRKRRITTTGTRTSREYNEKLKITPPVLGEFGRPATSNATLSGQMLNAMAIDAGPDGFRVYIADTPRRKVHPKQKAPTISNKEVAEHYGEKRPFMALTNGEVRILVRECELIIAEKIKQLIR